MIGNLTSVQRLFVKQVFEIAEIFSFETRNKYKICDEGGRDIAFAAEQQKGFLGILLRQFLGHWRSFAIHIFDMNRREVLLAEHPFRWYFQCLEVREPGGRSLGVVERRFAILSKRFEIRNAQGLVLFDVSSPFWRIWTFPFRRNERELARVSKKWSGLGSEIFTDRDNFMIEYLDSSLSNDERALVLAASLYIDLKYFENKGSGGGVDLMGIRD
jgi:uncharacterized protein YxjI